MHMYVNGDLRPDMSALNRVMLVSSLCKPSDCEELQVKTSVALKQKLVFSSFFFVWFLDITIKIKWENPVNPLYFWHSKPKNLFKFS